MNLKKVEFKVRILVLVVGLLLFSMIATFVGHEFQNYGSRISEQKCLDLYLGFQNWENGEECLD